MHPLITQEHIDTFRHEGVVLIRGLFDNHVDDIRAGIEQNLASTQRRISSLVKMDDFSTIIATGLASHRSST